MPIGCAKLLNLDKLGGGIIIPALEILDLAVVISEALPSHVKLVEALDVLSLAKGFFPLRAYSSWAIILALVSLGGVVTSTLSAILKKSTSELRFLNDYLATSVLKVCFCH